MSKFNADKYADEYYEKAEGFMKLIGKDFNQLNKMRYSVMKNDRIPKKLMIPKFTILGMEVEFHDGPVEVTHE